MGGRIRIVGTSHISRESIRSIRCEISEKKPEIVAVELDVQRLPGLFIKRRRIKLRDIRRLGLTAFVFNLIGGFIQQKLGEAVGIAPGSDIKSAILAAKKVRAKIFLIDQDVRLTLQRFSVVMRPVEKLKFVLYLVFSVLLAPFGFLARKKVQIDLAKVPEQRLIDQLTGELKKKFPVIYQILVEERDACMAANIKFLAKKFPESNLFVVVGAGHVRGIKRILKKKHVVE